MTSLEKARLIVRRSKNLKSGELECHDFDCDYGKKNECPAIKACGEIKFFPVGILACEAYIRKHDRRKRIRQVVLSSAIWLALSYLGCAIATDCLMWPVHPEPVMRLAGGILCVAFVCIGIIPVFFDRPRGEEDAE
jgi:hypothetical protein